MAYTEMSLPIDIPWKRIGASHDMIAQNFGYLDFPEKWRSSMALFYHEPDPADLPPEYCNRRITYLKVVATLTSYQVGGQDVSVLKELRDNHATFWGIKYFEENVVQVYPCYGALIQVGVYPNMPGVPLHEYPYISAFQPRKREMYETISQSGEKVSQSGTKLNVTKGSTTTDSTEDYDVRTSRGNEGVQLGILGEWGPRAETGQWGTVERREHVNQNVTTADASRDKRESFSSSTNINQLYSLLQGYHLGTNRAVFFMQPRPHIQDMKFSFIRGLRRLEGTQEFFLIINRPNSLSGLCFEVALETAHAHMFRTYYAKLIRRSDLYVDNNLSKTANALGIDTTTGSAQVFTRIVINWNNTPGYIRAMAKENRAGWLQWAYPGEVAALIYAGSMTYQQWDDVLRVVEIFPEIGTEDLAVIFEEFEYFSGDFFVTGRRLMSCFVSPPTAPEEEAGAGEGDSASAGTAASEGNVGNNDGETNQPMYGETSAESHISEYDPEPSIVYETIVTRSPSSFSPFTWNSLDHNTMGEILREVLEKSISSPDRMPYGKVSFSETEITLRNLSQLLRSLGEAGIQDKSLDDVKELKSLCREKVGSLSAKRVIELADISTEEIGTTFGLTKVEARKRRRELLVEALRTLDPKTVPPDSKIPDPLVKRFNAVFPSDVLKRMEESAGILREGPTYPTHRTKRSCLRRLLKRLY